MKLNGTITDVPGIKVGHAEDLQAITGCTVVLCEKGAIAGVDQRGGAPGTRETDAIRPLHLVSKIQAISLAGGSAYGLDAATGVMKYLEEKGLGFDTGVARVPVVPSAILFDLAIGSAKIRPDANMGYQACLNASTDAVEQGCVGAGTGAMAGNALGPALISAAASSWERSSLSILSETSSIRPTEPLLPEHAPSAKAPSRLGKRPFLPILEICSRQLLGKPLFHLPPPIIL